MRFYLLVVFTLLFKIATAGGQPCSCNFSEGGTDDSRMFLNYSILGSPQYYWNFGDGSTSYDQTPFHTFPESGKYLVTLYGNDTTHHCHAYYQKWITINKFSTDSCIPFFSDTVFNSSGTDYLSISDSSFNCGNYNSTVLSGPGQGWPFGTWISLSPWSSALFLSCVQFFTVDSTNPFLLRRAYYKTISYNFLSSLSYDSCSANFEYYIDYQGAAATVHLVAMNKSASNYDFEVLGFGSPIHYYSDTASISYPYIQNEKYTPWLIGLYTQDNSGCRDTVWQQLLIHNPFYLSGIIEEDIGINFNIHPNPVTQSLTVSVSKSLTESCTLEIFNMLGEKIIEQTLAMGSRQTTIDVSQLSPGIYFCKLLTHKGVAISKFVKE